MRDGKGTHQPLCRNMAQGEAFSRQRKGRCSAFAEADQVVCQAIEAVGSHPDGHLALVAGLPAAGGEFTERQGESSAALGTLEADRQFHDRLPCNKR